MRVSECGLLLLAVTFVPSTQAVRVDGGPNPQADPLPMFRGVAQAIPEPLAEALRVEGRLLSKIVHENSRHQHGKLGTNWYPLSDNPAPRLASEHAIELLRKIDFPGDLEKQHQVVGAEWWYQVRSRKEDIGFHFDKDEAVASIEMRLLHPVLSTVTYLTESGGPTLIFNQTSRDGNVNNPILARAGALFFPQPGKHINFHGNLMHGVLGELGGGQEDERITFLVNWWAVKVGEPNCVPLDQATADQLYEASKGQFDPSPLSPPETQEIVPTKLHLQEESSNRLLQIKYPPSEPVLFSLPQDLSADRNYVIEWDFKQYVTGAGKLDLFDSKMVNLVFHTSEPKIFLFHDGNQHLKDHEYTFLRAGAPYVEDVLLMTADHSQAGDAIRVFGLDRRQLPVVAAHDTQNDIKYIKPTQEPLDEASISAFIEAVLKGTAPREGDLPAERDEL